MPARISDKEFNRRMSRLSEYQVLSPYFGVHKNIMLRHECGYEFLITPAHLWSGRGCPKCRIAKRNARMAEIGKQHFYEMLQEKHLEIISPNYKYKNNRDRVKVQCLVCGRVQEVTPNNVNAGHGCKSCASRVDNKKEVFEKLLKKRAPDWELVGEYYGATVMTTFRHKKCGSLIDKVPYVVTSRPDSCRKCTPTSSLGENEIFDFVSQYCLDAVQGERAIISGGELDIYVPSKKVAIEFNGYYWHSLKMLSKKRRISEAKKYHYNKSKACEEQGVRLIHIWDYEWQDPRKQKVLKNIILGALGMLSERYYARECEVKRYDKDCPRWKELNQFFAENNIQGNRGGTVVFTLEREGRILMAYKFGRPSGGFAKKKYQYEMVRGASAPGVQVVGGASKLWKHFVEEMKPKSVVYYIDYNYFDGRSVEKLGGRFIGSQPGVKNYWVKTGEVKNREPRRHKEIKKAIEKGEVLELWNAGTKTYAFAF